MHRGDLLVVIKIQKVKYKIGQKKSELNLGKLLSVSLISASLILTRVYIGQNAVVDGGSDYLGVVEAAAVEAVSTEASETEIIASRANLRSNKSILEDDIKSAISDAFKDHKAANVSIAIEGINEDYSSYYNAAQTYNAASLYKTLAAYRVLQRVDNNEINLSQVAIDSLTVQECIDLAITVSDNPCGIALQSLAQASHTDKLVKSWGLTNTTLSGYFPQTSALDQIKLYRMIYAGDGLSAESQKLLLDNLKNQQINNRTPKIQSAQFIHKTGDLDSTVNNSGIVITRSGQIYAFSILTDKWEMTIPEKYQLIADLQLKIYNLIDNYVANI